MLNDDEKPAVRRRRQLPARRPSETRRLHWAGRTISLTIGYDPDRFEPKEVFYSGGYKRGSDMEALVSDLCIALSVMLQHEGVTVDTLGKSMGQAFDALTGEAVPASILGLLLDELARPPDWFGGEIGAVARTEPVPSEDYEISGDAEVDPRVSGEAGRQDVPGPESAARHETRDHAPEASASGEAKT